MRIGELAFGINPGASDEIYYYFFYELESARLQSPASSGKMYKADATRESTSWADDTWAYLYPDGTGGKHPGKPSTLDGITNHLDYYMNELGVRVFYLLPLTRSPNRDGRYDVSDYRSVDPALGGDKAFFRLIREVRKRDGHVVMDLIPAHVSEDHDWFRRALAGDPRFMSYFLTSDAPPKGTLICDNDGNAWLEYTCKQTGTTYRRLLLFPDLSQSHWIPERIQTGGDETTLWFYSSFFPFQKDLDLRNPEVIREHLQTIGYWLSMGVSGIRADAIPWWVKPAGHSGQHAVETGFLCELFHRYIKLINPAAVFLPELVESIRTSRRYIGRQVEINGVITGALSDTVFAFEKVVHILYAGVFGDFLHWSKHLEETGNLDFPANTRLLLYTGNHHDEIYLGFLPDHDEGDGEEAPKKRFQKRITDCGGVVYKNGNSGGAMLSSLLENDTDRILSFYKFLLGHFGVPAVYGGTELGLGNAWPHALQKTFEYIEELSKKHILKKDHPVFDEIKKLKPGLQCDEPVGFPAPQSSLFRFIDGRLLHRNRITDSLIESAMKGENKVFSGLKRLLRARRLNPALKSGGPEEALHTMRRDIGSFVRRYRNERGDTVDETAVIHNGTKHRTEVNVSLENLTAKHSFRLWEIEAEKHEEFQMHDGFATIRLEPYETLWLRVTE